MNFQALVFAASLAATLTAAEAKCTLVMPASDWSKASSKGPFGGGGFNCKTNKCGGTDSRAVFGEKRLGGISPEQAAKGKPLLLRYNGMKGAATVYGIYLYEYYYHDNWVLLLGVATKNAAIRKSNMALLKKSLRCN